MADEIGALRVALSADHAQLSSDFGKAHAAVRTFTSRARVAMHDFGKSVTSTLGDIQKWSRALALATGAGAIAGMTLLVKSAVKTAGEMYNLAQSAGISTESFSTLAHAARMSDLDLAEFAKGLHFLNISAVEAADGEKKAVAAFTAIGVSATDAAGKVKPADALLRELVVKFAKLEDGPRKSALAMALFGQRTGEALIPLLNMGTELANIEQEARDLGKEISTEFGRNAEDFGDTIERVTAQLEGVAITIAEPVLPALEDMAKAFHEAAKQGGILTGVYEAFVTAVLGGQLAHANKDLENLFAQRRYLMTFKAMELASGPSAPGRSYDAYLSMFGETPDLEENARRIAELQAKIGGMEWSGYKQGPEAPRRQAPSIKPPEDEKAAGQTEADKAAERALKAGEAAIEQLLRERDVREGTSKVEQLAFELESGNLQELHRLRTEGTAAEQKQAAAIEERLGVLARELDLRQMIQGIEEATAERMAANADRAAQIIDEGVTEADRLRAQLEELDALHKRLPTSLLVGGGLGDESLLSDAQYEQARQRIQMMLDAAVATERYEARMQALTEAVAAGKMTHEAYDAAIAATALTMEETASAIIDQWALVDSAFEDWSRRATDALVNFCMTGKMSFGDFARSVIADLLQIQIQSEMTSLFKGLQASSLGAAISGLLSSGSTVLPMVPGSVVAAKPLSTMGEAASYGMSELRSAAKLASYGAVAPEERAPVAPQAPQSIRVINVLDPALVNDWAASPAGEKVILNAIAKHATQLRTILR